MAERVGRRGMGGGEAIVGDWGFYGTGLIRVIV